MDLPGIYYKSVPRCDRDGAVSTELSTSKRRVPLPCEFEGAIGSPGPRWEGFWGGVVQIMLRWITRWGGTDRTHHDTAVVKVRVITGTGVPRS